MRAAIARSLVAAALSGLSGLASAGSAAIDLFGAGGVPGTGGDTTVLGPCYCDQHAFFSPVFVPGPGTYDFGKVRVYWVLSNPTPDGGDNQPYLYLLFDPVETVGTWPDSFAGLDNYVYPAADAFCAADDAACNAAHAGAYVDVDLVYTVPPGQNAIQIGLIGNYRYTSPLPEPLAWSTSLLGLVLLAASATKRGGRAVHRRGRADPPAAGPGLSSRTGARRARRTRTADRA